MRDLLLLETVMMMIALSLNDSCRCGSAASLAGAGWQRC